MFPNYPIQFSWDFFYTEKKNFDAIKTSLVFFTDYKSIVV